MKKLIPLVLFILLAFLDPFKDKLQEGISHYSHGKYDEALKSFDEASEYSAPASSRAALEYNKGKAYAALQKETEAVDSYMKAVSAGNDEIRKKSFFNMGNIYAKSGRKKLAAENYIAALKIDPEYEKARKNLEYLNKKNENNNGENKSNSKNSGGKSSDDRKSDSRKSSEGKEKGGDKRNQSKSDGNDKNTGENRTDSGLLDSVLENMKNNPVRKGRKRGDEIIESDRNW